MSKTISQLWNGKVVPINNLGVNNPELKELECLMCRHLEKLEKYFNREAKEIFEKYNKYVNDYNYEIREQAFCIGFSLGTKITAEALVKAE
ncbi:MAG: hypothetical protein IKD04_06395 [Clostridia bacterium]|nr:hypothetical protein [Clostridia bacterium]